MRNKNLEKGVNKIVKEHLKQIHREAVVSGAEGALPHPELLKRSKSYPATASQEANKSNTMTNINKELAEFRKEFRFDVVHGRGLDMENWLKASYKRLLKARQKDLDSIHTDLLMAQDSTSDPAAYLDDAIDKLEKLISSKEV